MMDMIVDSARSTYRPRMVYSATMRNRWRVGLRIAMGALAFAAGGCGQRDGAPSPSGDAATQLDAEASELDGGLADAPEGAYDAPPDRETGRDPDATGGPCDPPDDAPAAAHVVACEVYRSDSLVQEEDHLYWAERRTTPDGGTDYFIRMVSKAGGTPITLVQGIQYTRQIASDGSFVYWADFGSCEVGKGAIAKVDVQSGQVTTLVPAIDCPDQLAIDNQYIYFSVAGDIARVPKSGGTVDLLAEGNITPTALIFVEPNLYWLNPTEVDRLQADPFAPDAGPRQPTALFHSSDSLSYGLAFAQGQLYWTTGRLGGVWTMSADPGDADTARRLTPEAAAWALSVDESHVYWTASKDGIDVQHTFVRAMPLGGVQSESQVTQLGTGSNVVADDQYVYWVADDGVHPGPLLAAKKADIFGDD